MKKFYSLLTVVCAAALLTSGVSYANEPAKAETKAPAAAEATVKPAEPVKAEEPAKAVEPAKTEEAAKPAAEPAKEEVKKVRKARKAVKLTPEQINEMIVKFRAANANCALPENFSSCTCEDKKVCQGIVKQLKSWCYYADRAANEKMSQKKRDKAKARAEKIAAEVNAACAKHCVKAEATVVPGEYQPKTEKGRQVMELIKGKK